jgi:hypothetical protein
MSQITGRVYITINGTRLRSKEGARLNVGGPEREAVTSDAGVDGYAERIAVPMVDFSINHTPTISLTQLQGLVGATLIFETDTGSIFTLQGAWCAKPPEMSKGDVSLQFMGTECIEG